MLGPVSNEDEGTDSGTGRARALSLVTCACRCRCRCMWRCGAVVSAVRARGLSRGVSTSAPGRVGVFAGGSRGC